MADSQEHLASERSPLLGGSGSTANGHIGEDAERQAADGEQDGTDEVVLAEEASNKKLVAILFTLFIGVFFAALGEILVLDLG